MRTRSTGHLGYSKGYEYIVIPSGEMFGGCIYRSDMADPVIKAPHGTLWYRESESFYCTVEQFRKMIDNPLALNLYNERGGRYHERTIFKRMESPGG
jgi:hypothetical protein